jgi:hypothetical protein
MPWLSGSEFPHKSVISILLHHAAALALLLAQEINAQSSAGRCELMQKISNSALEISSERFKNVIKKFDGRTDGCSKIPFRHAIFRLNTDRPKLLTGRIRRGVAEVQERI